MPRARGMAAYVRDGYGAFLQPKFECGCCEMLVFRVCGATQNLCVFSLYRNPDLDDQIYDCLLTAIAAVQAAAARDSFLFVLLPRTVMILLTTILPLCQDVINW